METVIQTRFVHTRRQPMQLDALAKLVTQTQVPAQQLCAQVVLIVPAW